MDTLLALLRSEFGLNVLAGLVGTFISATIIGPIVALMISRQADRKWRPFRKYVGYLLEENHRDMIRTMSSAQDYMSKAARMTPDEARQLITQNFDFYRSNITNGFNRIEDIGVRFHFAMNPLLMHKWQKYHVLATSTLGDVVRHLDTTWRNTAGVVSALQAGKGEAFSQNPNLFDDVFSTPMKVGSQRLSSMDMNELDARLNAFVISL